jgi:4-aminobutyrate aminotransferase-like enzyme
LNLPERARQLGAQLQPRLQKICAAGKALEVRGRGLMWGLELSDGVKAQRAVIEALRHGVVALQAGPQGNVLSITPPLIISEAQLFRAIDIVEECL